MEMAQDALPCVAFPREVWKKKWVVYCKPTLQGADQVLQYLARYVHRVAITNNRILAVEDDRVTFRYRKTKNRKKDWKSRWVSMTLPVMEFMRRFLQHMLPKGFHKVRYYGLLGSANRSLLRQIQLQLASNIKSDDIPVAETEDGECSSNHGRRCRFCNEGVMIVVGILSRVWREYPARSPP